MGKIIKSIIAILALPLVIGFSKMFYSQIAGLSFVGAKFNLLLWGFVSYVLMHVLFYKPVYIYTWGHEVMHVIATWLCGGHVTVFNISKYGGNVGTSKTNFFIELSPYFVPIYTLLLIFLMPVVRYKLARPEFLAAYIFLLGFTLGMHLIMTAEVIKMKQPDIHKSGYAFSLTLIYIVNLMVIVLVLGILIKDLSFKNYFMKSINYAVDIYMRILNQLF